MAPLLGWATQASAQDRSVSTEQHFRNQCRLAAQVMRTGHPHPQYRWARGYIDSCTEEGPEIVAELWRTARPDTAELIPAVWSASRLRDVRIYEELGRVATDSRRPELVRVGAMLALSRYASPSSLVWFHDVRVPEGGVRRIPFVPSSTTGAVQLEGSAPLRRPVAGEVLLLLREIAESREAEPVSVWYAAAILARRVAAAIEAGLSR